MSMHALLNDGISDAVEHGNNDKEDDGYREEVVKEPNESKSVRNQVNRENNVSEDYQE